MVRRRWAPSNRQDGCFELSILDEIQREARVAEVAERLSFPQSSTSILLNCLVDLGYMDYLPESRSFIPSPRVTLLGTWLDKGPVRNGSLIRMLEEISQKTGDTIIIAARNGIFSQYIHVLQARSAMRFHVPQGSRRLVVWSATGFALLTGCSEKEIKALVTRTNAEAAPGQPRVDIHQVLENVRQTRRAGYYFSTGLVTPGAGSIAIPLPDGIDGRNRADRRRIRHTRRNQPAGAGNRRAAQRCRAALPSIPSRRSRQRAAASNRQEAAKALAALRADHSTYLFLPIRFHPIRRATPTGDDLRNAADAPA